VRKVSDERRRAGNEVKRDGRYFEVGFPNGQDLNQQKLGQDDVQAQAHSQRGRLEMTDRTRAIRAQAFFGVEKIDK